MAIGGHQSPRMGKDGWLTPPWLLDAVGRQGRGFDLDPCVPINRPWDIAKKHLTIVEDGYASPWAPDDFVWLNPPYGQHTWGWLDKLAGHPAGGLALVFARTETTGFVRSIWQAADGIFFLEGRLTFFHADGSPGQGNGGAPSCIAAYGPEALRRLRDGAAKGHLHGALLDNRSWQFHARNGQQDRLW